MKNKYIDYSDVLFDVIQRSNNRQTFLLCTDVLDGWEFYDELLSDTVSWPSKIGIFDNNAQENIEIFANDLSHIYDLLSGELFGQILTVNIGIGHVIVHNDHRSSISLVIADRIVVSKYMKSWDARFCQHLKRNRVGFGDAGKKYAQSVIESLLVQFPNDKARINLLFNCIS